MKVLFLDDERYRHELFAEKYVAKDAEVWHVHDVAGAVARLEASSPFDVVCLDHDLGGDRQRQTVGGSDCAHDGCQVARHIATMPPEKRPRRAVVHSFNAAGRQEIASILHDAAVSVVKAPFTTFFVGARPGGA